MDFAVSAEHKVKLKENEKRDKYPDFAIELKKIQSMKVTVMPIGVLSTVTRGLEQETGGLGNKRMSGDHPNYSIINISQNTEKSHGDLLSLRLH